MERGSVEAVVAPWPRGKLRGADRVGKQREYARRALALAATLASAKIGELAQDERGAPLPSNGWHWSLSHCTWMVAACVHRSSVGIDVEDRQDVRVEVVERVLSAPEIALFERRGEPGFLRAWTAKEALLKELGIGLAGLSRCKIVEVGDGEVVVELDATRRRVWQGVQREYVVAVSSADDAPVRCHEWGDPLPDAAGSHRWS